MTSYVDGLKLDDMTVTKSGKAPIEFTSFGDFEIFLLHPGIASYGLEVESKFQEKPCFAGGKGSRNFLTMTLQVAEGDTQYGCGNTLFHQAPRHDGRGRPYGVPR